MRTSTNTRQSHNETPDNVPIPTSTRALRLPPLELDGSVEDHVQYILAVLNEDPDLVALAPPEPLYAKIRLRLRILVDEWIDSAFTSGFTKRESETPSERTFERSPKCKKALYAFSKGGGMVLLPFGNTPSLYFDREGTGFITEGGSLDEIVYPDIAFILLSYLRERLAKCRDCNTYFVLKHRKSTYSRGTKCERCWLAGRTKNSVQTTASVRSDAYDDLYQKAAKKFHMRLTGVTGWHKDKALKVAIAAYLSPYVLRSDTLRSIHPNGITGKWTAQKRNWEGIEKALKATPDVATKPKSARKAKRFGVTRQNFSKCKHLTT